MQLLEIEDYYEILPCFVYGTLMQGFNNHFFVCPNDGVKQASIKGEIYLLYQYGFPGVTKGDRTVRGELVYIKEKRQLINMDYLEGAVAGDFSRAYTRIKTLVDLEDGSSVKAWTYLFNSDYIGKNDIQLKNGSWKEAIISGNSYN